MQHKFGFILALGLVYVCSTVAGDIPAPKAQSHPGFFKVAIGRRVNDDTTLFDPIQAKLEAQDLRASYEAISPSVVARADDPPSTAAPAESTPSGTAKLKLQAELETFQIGTVTSSGILNYGSIGFGTPQQELPLYVSTGSADIWVRSGCRTCSEKMKLFDKKASTSYVDKGGNYSIPFASGQINATIAEDVVSVQGRLLVQKQAFGVVSQAPQDSTITATGLVGLGFGSNSYSKQPSFVENLITAKALTKPIVSIHLARPGQKIGSEVCFGCFDDEKTTGSVDSVSWVPLVTNKTWTVALTGLSVDNKTAENFPNVAALISTFGNGIDLPRNLAELFYGLIPGARPATEYKKGYFEFPCNKSISVSLKLGSSNFPLNAADFILGPSPSDKSYCIGGIRYLDKIQPNTAVIGDIFFKSWYTTLNYGNFSIGFSPSINNK